jgi:hypothetical protein
MCRASSDHIQQTSNQLEIIFVDIPISQFTASSNQFPENAESQPNTNFQLPNRIARFKLHQMLHRTSSSKIHLGLEKMAKAHMIFFLPSKASLFIFIVSLILSPFTFCDFTLIYCLPISNLCAPNVACQKYCDIQMIIKGIKNYYYYYYYYYTS